MPDLSATAAPVPSNAAGLPMITPHDNGFAAEIGN